MGFSKYNPFLKRRATRNQPSVDNRPEDVASSTPTQPAGDSVKVLFGPKRPLVDIVFVHGIRPQWHQVWGGYDAHSSWLSFVAEAIPDARMIVCGFDYERCLVAGVESLSAACKSLFETLAQNRAEIDRPIVFIAHSLGGLILREAIVCSHNQDIINATDGMVFFGTPNFHTVEEFASFRARLAEALGNRTPSNGPELQHLLDVNKTFQHLLGAEPDFETHYYAETLPVYRVGLIVPPCSAALTERDAIHRQADHLTLAQFDSIFSQDYQAFIKRLKQMCTSSTNMLPRGPGGTSSRPSRRPSLLTSLLPDGRNELETIKVDSRNEKAVDLAKEALKLEDRWKYQEAHDKYEEARKLSLPLNNNLNFFCSDKCSLMLMHKYQYTAAETLSRNTLQARSEFLGPANRLTLMSAANLARALRFRGKFEAAYDILRDALANITGSPYQFVEGIVVVSILAKVLKDQGVFDVAVLLSWDVVRGCYYNTGLGRDHPFTFNRECDLAVVLSKQGHFVAAEKITRRAMEGMQKTLRPNNPYILRTSKRLASYLRFQGRLSEACEILRPTLVQQTAQLGPRHPDTLSTKCSLGAALALVFQADEARSLLHEAFADRDATLEPTHPDLEWVRKATRKLDDMYHNAPDAEFYTVFQKPTPPSTKRTPDFDPRRHEKKRIERLLEELTGDKIIQSAKTGKGIRLAAAVGDVERLKLLIRADVNISTTGGYWGDALQAASYCGQLETVKFLLDSEVDVNANTGIFGFALRAASLQGNIDIVDLLLSKGAYPHGYDPILGTALQAAQAGNHKAVAAKLIRAKNAFLDKGDILAGTPLQLAAWEGNVPMVKMFLKAKANPNIERGSFGTAFKLAASGNHDDVLGLLLEAGGKELSDSKYNEALKTAVEAGHYESAGVMLRNPGDKRDRVSVAELLAESGASRRDMVEMLLHSRMPENSATDRIETDEDLLLQGLSPVVSSSATDLDHKRSHSLNIPSIDLAASSTHSQSSGV